MERTIEAVDRVGGEVEPILENVVETKVVPLPRVRVRKQLHVNDMTILEGILKTTMNPRASRGEHSFACVPPLAVTVVWPHARSYLARAQEACGVLFDGDALLSDLKKKRLLLWIVYTQKTIDCALITRLMKGRDGLSCEIMACGGRGMKSWLGFMPIIERYAKAEGCDKLRVVGRLGWRRILKEFEPTGVVLEKRV